MSITKSSCVTTLDKLAKNPYFQKVKSAICVFIFDLKSIFIFFIKNIEVKRGVINNAIVYPTSLK